MSVSGTADQHVYCLALYGVRSSGKTCILSALSLPRLAHPDGLSCSWIENLPGHDLPDGDPESWETDDPYHIGWQWLSKQRKRMKEGEVPNPNPNRDPMRFMFDFGSPEHGTRHVELIDYSGELITASASELAAALREHMRECDGLLILAEPPRPGGNAKLLAEDLDKLGGAFRELLNERNDSAPRHNWPIALLFNKWDRCMAAGKNGDHRPIAQLRDFLGQSPTPPHASLLNTIRNAVGDNNVSCFPVSAFGAHCIRNDGAEVPLLHEGQLQSFALEDGFVWVARRCDELRVEQLETAARAASWWAFPQVVLGANGSDLGTETSAWKRWLRGVSTASGISYAWRLRRQFPKSGQLRNRVIRALRTFAVKFASQFAVLGVLLLVLLLAVETVGDGIRYRTIRANQENPSADVEELRRDEDWLEAYFCAPGFRHVVSNKIVVGRSDAHDALVGTRTRRDDSRWQTVIDAENAQTRVGLARKYLAAFPAGLHWSDAETIVADADRQEKELENADHLSKIKLKIDAVEAKAHAPLDGLHALAEEVAALPHPEARSQLIVDSQRELRNLITKKQAVIAEATKNAEWQAFKRTYESSMKSHNISEAAAHLDGRLPQDARFLKLCNDFARRAPAMIKNKVRDALKNRSWEAARASVRIMLEPNVAKRLPARDVKELQELGREIDHAEDRDLYKQILRYRPQCSDQVEAYLSRAPIKTMKAEVEQYQKYLNQMEGDLKLTLTLNAIRWDGKYYSTWYDYDNDVTVQLRGKTVISASGIESKPNARTGKIDTAVFKAKLNQRIAIDVSIVAKYGKVWTSTTSGGSGNWTGTPEQLRSGVTVDVKGDGFTNRATFSLAGIPEEPALPTEWKSR